MGQGPGPAARPDRRQRGPRLGRRMARFNRAVTNRVMLPVARQVPGLGVVVHTGRRTGRTYETPVIVFCSEGSVTIALTYGRDSDWVQNVLAAGGCRLLTRRRELHLTHPEVFHDETRNFVPVALRLVLDLVGVEDFMRLTVLDRQGSA